MLKYKYDKLIFKYNEVEGLISKNEKFKFKRGSTKHGILRIWGFPTLFALEARAMILGEN